MNGMVLFRQLLVLFALMLTGFICYKRGLLDEHANTKISSLLVWVLNPCLMLSGVIGKDSSFSTEIVFQNIVMVLALYSLLFFVGWIYILLFRHKGKDSYLYRMEYLFPNVGFMGVPLVREVFGSEYIVFVAFYMLAFNVICYTYGIHLAARYGGNREKFDPKRLISPGTITAVLAILVFFLRLPVPAPIGTYVDYLGNCAIAFSMIIIGGSLAKINWKTGFSNPHYYIFLVSDMILVPILMVLLSKLIPFDPAVIGVFQIMCCMPVASMTCMFAQEYGGDGTECAKLVALTTIATVITAPFVIWLVG